jgi:nitrogen fixation NifU-like protein
MRAHQEQIPLAPFFKESGGRISHCDTTRCHALIGVMAVADRYQSLYRDLVLEHAREPRHATPLPPPCLRAEARNLLCGDSIAISLKLDAHGRIAAIGHASEGCVLCVASASLMCEHVLGGDRAAATLAHATLLPLLRGDAQDDAAALGDLAALAGVAAYPSRRRCVLLPWEALLQALAPDAAVA